MQIQSAMNGIHSTAAPAAGAGAGTAPSGASPGLSFEQLMTRMLQEADQPQQAVTQDMNRLLAGDMNNIHDVAINVAKADVAFRLVMEVRDKLISAYQEVMRMQV